MTEMTSALGLPVGQVRGLLMAAARAPSVHNTQPWRFRLTPQTIELHADPARQLTVADPNGAELRISCGTALFNLRLALNGLGIRPIVTVLPDPARPDLVAVIRHGGRKAPTPAQLRLLEAIPLRRTNRRPFSDTPVALPEQHALRRAALDEGAWLHVVDDGAQLAELGRMARKAHETQMADSSFRAELAQWTGRTPDRLDGVPARAGGPLPEPQDIWVLRDFTDGHGRTRADGKDFEEEPLIAVLSTHAGGPREDVRAGQALQRVLLTATVHGLTASFLSQLVELPDVRDRMRRLISGTRPPQVVLRIGYGWPIAPTLRRPVEDLVMTTPLSPLGHGSEPR